jgi:hypothetical protein
MGSVVALSPYTCVLQMRTANLLTHVFLCQKIDFLLEKLS